MKKLLSVLLTCVLLANCFVLSVFPTETDPATEGMAFDSNTTYRIGNSLSAAPAVVEADIYFPDSFKGNGGNILGNYDGRQGTIQFGVFGSSSLNSGYLQVSWKDPGDSLASSNDNYVHDYIFWNTDVYTGKWVNIKFERDYVNGVVNVYVDGTKHTINMGEGNNAANYADMTRSETETVLTRTYVLGGDMRAANTRNFKGRMKNLKAYDAAGNEILNYDMTSGAIVDNTGKNAVVEDKIWVDEIESDDNVLYSMAVVGDTQNLVASNPDNIHCIYDWIIANKESKKIELSLGLGDIVNGNSATEYENAIAQISKLDGVVPYTLIRGNDSHETQSNYDDYIGATAWAATIPAENRYLEGSVRNAYKTFEISGVPYLVLMLDCAADDATLEWACGVVEAHSDYNVIVTTHAYLDFDGTYLDANDETSLHPTGSWNALNNGDDIWNEFVSKYENICMVLCGHIGYDKVVVSEATGDNGNTVVQVLTNHQNLDSAIDGGAGIVTMLNFLGDGETVAVETYSTVQEKYFYESNQFTFKLDLIGNHYDVNGDGEVTVADVMSLLDAILNKAANVNDINGDGVVSLKDVLRIAKMIG